MPPLIALSIALHVVAVLAAAVEPSWWQWAVGAIVGNHLLLGALSLLPRSTLLGRNVNRLPPPSIARGEVAISIDDGPDPLVTPHVLDLLDAHHAKATFFCIGSQVAAHPELAREILRRGHALENHSARHGWHFAFSGPRGFVREISDAQQTIAAVTGDPPRLFRPPAGIRNPFLDFALRRLDLTLVSWTRRAFDTIERDPGVVVAKLTHNLAAGDILLLHDGHAARSSDGTPVIILGLPRLLDAIGDAGLRAVTLREALDPARETTRSSSLRTAAP